MPVYRNLVSQRRNASTRYDLPRCAWMRNRRKDTKFGTSFPSTVRLASTWQGTISVAGSKLVLRAANPLPLLRTNRLSHPLRTLRVTRGHEFNWPAVSCCRAEAQADTNVSDRSAHQLSGNRLHAVGSGGSNSGRQAGPRRTRPERPGAKSIGQAVSASSLSMPTSFRFQGQPATGPVFVCWLSIRLLISADSPFCLSPCLLSRLLLTYSRNSDSPCHESFASPGVTNPPSIPSAGDRVVISPSASIGKRRRSQCRQRRPDTR